jgi:hypothetical protein
MPIHFVKQVFIKNQNFSPHCARLRYIRTLSYILSILVAYTKSYALSICIICYYWATVSKFIGLHTKSPPPKSGGRSPVASKTVLTCPRSSHRASKANVPEWVVGNGRQRSYRNDWPKPLQEPLGPVAVTNLLCAVPLIFIKPFIIFFYWSIFESYSFIFFKIIFSININYINMSVFQPKLFLYFWEFCFLWLWFS